MPKNMISRVADLKEDDINIDGEKMSHWLGAYRKME
jgi:hypothetical protein